MRFRSRAFEQVLLEQAGIAVGVFNRYPALIGKGHDDLRPVQVLLGQMLEKRHRATTARHHQHRVAACSNGLAQLLGNVQRQTFGQQHRTLEFVSVHARRQLHIRYRHTTTSRPA